MLRFHDIDMDFGLLLVQFVCRNTVTIRMSLISERGKVDSWVHIMQSNIYPHSFFVHTVQYIWYISQDEWSLALEGHGSWNLILMLQSLLIQAPESTTFIHSLTDSARIIKGLARMLVGKGPSKGPANTRGTDHLIEQELRLISRFPRLSNTEIYNTVTIRMLGMIALAHRVQMTLNHRK